MTTRHVDEFEERFPLQRVELGNGETLSYVDYCHGGRAKHEHTLLVIPGYGCDSMFMTFTLAQYQDALGDHRIIGVDPRGYGESTLNSENWSHEENAQDMGLFLDALGIQKTMVMGFSTGGGAAAWLALQHPHRISAVWMLGALPLDGMRTSLLDPAGKTTGNFLSTRQEAVAYADRFMTPTLHSPQIQKFRMAVGASCLDARRLPPETDRGVQFHHRAALRHRSRASAIYANNAFNLTPIQTPIAPPTRVLQGLQCPMIVLHGSHDALIKTRQVRAVAELALAERWAPKGTLVYYEIPNCGHMFIYDNPTGFRQTYRRALETHIMKTSETANPPPSKL